MRIFNLTRLFLLTLALSGFVPALGQRPLAEREANTYQLRWSAPVTSQFSESEIKTFLWFDGASYDAENNFLPLFTNRQKLPAGSTGATATIQNAVYAALDQASITALGTSAALLPAEAEVTVKFTLSRKEPFANVSILPLRKNPANGQMEKLVSFSLIVRGNANTQRISSTASAAFANSSVLASGTWYRIGTVTTGIYKLDYNFLSGLGLDMAALDPANIRLYGNGRGQLPYTNAGTHKDDLVEYAITVKDNNSNSTFDSDDYVLFYGVSPNTWNYNPGHSHYHHSVNNYSDTTFYFLNTDLGPGKRIQSQASGIATPTDTVSSFDDYQFHEYDNENMIKSGREWYGEKFDILNSYSFAFNFPNIDMSSPACTEVDLISRSDGTNTFSVTAQSCTGTIIGGTTSSTCYYCPYAAGSGTSLCCIPTGPVINVTITKQTSSATGWLNWVRVNARRHLKMAGSQMSFRDSRTAGAGNVAQYVFDGYNSNISIWDVTDLSNIGLQSGTPLTTTFVWTLAADSVREFIAFDGSSYLTAVNFGQVQNQNLHALQPVDFIIISHPDFLAQAEELGQLHLVNDSLSYLIVTPQQIYNEFSSGAQDVTAIRDFLKMLYERAATPADIPRYVLLFGDGSYDNKHRMPSNTNFIPTFQNRNSVGPTESYVADEYYGLLDDQGEWDDGGDAGDMDVGIGRFPVRSVSEAQAVVDKVRIYITRQQPVINPSVCAGDACTKGGEWKNWLTFIGDDEDSDIHMSQADQLATYVDTLYDNYNIDKIYLDAYQQLQTPGGERYPNVNEAIDKRVDMGSLMINYTGHGGEVGLAHERILEIAQINAWTNLCNMPLFITATCEFSRFDDPSRTSAGEYILLNGNGGGIGLLTTVRLVYSTPNFNLNRKFYECAFDPINGEMPRMGDLYRITKVNSGNNTNNRNFTLLGDPALLLNYPVNQVTTTEVNNVVITSQPDTLRALSHVTIEGYVADTAGNVMSGFNGVLYPTVFDKAKTITTLGNDPPNPVYTFQLQKSVLYHGKVSVVNGYFSYSFVVPRDIAYQYGKGRVSYFADNGVTDASGNHENIIIGGSNPNAPADVTGPQIKLYLNDSNFVFGGITNSSPKLFAVIRDSNGVNTVGNGIGHDVVAILDDETGNAIVLNDYYQADMNSYQSGKIIYPFSDLAPGKHTLTLKVWDVYNNSSTVKTEFMVTAPEGLSLEHVINYPNPFTTHTSFFVEYNQCCTEYDIMIQVFTVSGKLVKTINEHVNAEGFRSEPIEWDGRDDYNDKIGRGVYIYHVVARTAEGMTADKYEKLVILN
ncbi:MAG: type IX secretion system sortase PorU [Bacteroidota bacterium]|nr:type IX secretion system sortase PorU [Bacteroidota bacterium]